MMAPVLPATLHFSAAEPDPGRDPWAYFAPARPWR